MMPSPSRKGDKSAMHHLSGRFSCFVSRLYSRLKFDACTAFNKTFRHSSSLAIYGRTTTTYPNRLCVTSNRERQLNNCRITPNKAFQLPFLINRPSKKLSGFWVVRRIFLSRLCPGSSISGTNLGVSLDGFL